MNTENINLKIEELETKIKQAQNRMVHADTRQQQANDQRDIDSLRAQLKELENESSKTIKASQIIKESCCGNFLCTDKDKLVKMVEDLEGQVALLENQLNNAIAEIQRLKNG